MEPKTQTSLLADNPMQIQEKLATLSPLEINDFLLQLKNSTSRESIGKGMLLHIEKKLSLIQKSFSDMESIYDVINKRIFAEANQQEIEKLQDNKKQVLESIKDVEKQCDLLLALGFDNSKILKVLNGYKIRYTKYLVGIGDKYESGLLAFSEGKNNVAITDAINMIPSIIQKMDHESMLNYLSGVYNGIFENNFRSELVKNSYSSYTKALNKAIFDKLVNESEKMSDKKGMINKYDLALLNLSKIITGRAGEGEYITSIDSELKDPKLASDILLYLVEKKLGLIDDLSQKGFLNISDNLLDSVKPYDVYKSFIEDVNYKIGPGVAENILNNIGFSGFEEIKGKSYSELTIEQKIKSSIIVRVFNRLSKLEKYGLQELSNTFLSLGNQGYELVRKSIDSQLLEGFSIFGKKGRDFGLSGVSEEIFDLYSEIEGSGLLNFSDETMNYLKVGGKMAGVIGVTILGGIAVGLSLPVSVPTLAGAAITGAVVGTVGTTASILIQGQGYDTSTDMLKDVGSQLAINLPLGAVGGVAGAKFTQAGMGLLTKEGLRATGINSGLEATNLATGIGAEWSRQRHIMGTELDVGQMTTTGAIFSVAGLVASKFAGAKINHPNKENLDILATTYNTSPIESQKAIYSKLLNGKKLTSKETADFIDTIVKNHPYVGILRLGKGDIVRNFSFGGLKGLNDTMGQKFADQIINVVQSKIKENVKGMKIRKVREETKNLTYGCADGLTLDEFYKIATMGLDDILKINGIDDLIKQAAYQNTLISRDKKGIIKMGKHRIKTENILSFIENNPSEYDAWKKQVNQDKVLLEIFNENVREMEQNVSKLKVNVGEMQVEDDGQNEKLKAFLLSERAGVMADVIGEKYGKFDPELLVRFKEKVANIENMILSKNDEMVLLPNGASVKLVLQTVDVKGNPISVINESVLRVVRKGHKLNDPKLDELVRDYLRYSNSYLDCIKSGTFDSLNQDFETAKEFDKLIGDVVRNNHFNVDETKLLENSLFKNQKGVVTKEYFETLVSERNSGTLVFVDIKDMFLLNHQDFRKINSNLIKIDGSIDYDQLLKAGDSVTKKFMNIVNALKQYYGNDIILTLGGDEIKFYIPSDYNDSIMKNNLAREGLNGRITYKKLSDKNDPKTTKQSIDSLDRSCGIIKLVEEKIMSLRNTYGGLLNDRVLDICMQIGDINPSSLKSDEAMIRSYLFDKNSQFNADFVKMLFVGDSVGNVHIGNDYYLSYSRGRGFVINRHKPQDLPASQPDITYIPQAA